MPDLLTPHQITDFLRRLFPNFPFDVMKMTIESDWSSNAPITITMTRCVTAAEFDPRVAVTQRFNLVPGWPLSEGTPTPCT